MPGLSERRPPHLTSALHSTPVRLPDPQRPARTRSEPNGSRMFEECFAKQRQQQKQKLQPERPIKNPNSALHALRCESLHSATVVVFLRSFLLVWAELKGRGQGTHTQDTGSRILLRKKKTQQLSRTHRTYINTAWNHRQTKSHVSRWAGMVSGS